jgi:hypothetical protein
MKLPFESIRVLAVDDQPHQFVIDARPSERDVPPEDKGRMLALQWNFINDAINEKILKMAEPGNETPIVLLARSTLERSKDFPRDLDEWRAFDENDRKNATC